MQSKNEYEGDRIMGINIGLDIGIASVGLAVVDSDTGNVLETVADLFNCAEVSENVKRREFRQARRLKRRQHTRLEDFKKLWVGMGFIIPENINIYPIELKVRALRGEITMDELYVVLYNSLKHRGISYLDDFEGTVEGGSEYQKGIQINQQQLETKYPCEIQLERIKKYGAYRGNITVEENGEKAFMVTAINETLKEEFRHNPDTFIYGQDVANKEKGGVFNITKGMQQEFGDARVFNAPIAEDYIVGTANGMCRFDPKIHVVIEGAEFADYFWPAVEQYVECTHEYWRSNGKFVPNIVLRLASGGYIGGGLYHSQNIEGALATLPGARIVCPSFADDAAGLLRTAMRSRGFTLYLEPKALYNSVEASSVVPEEFEVPFGKARIRREGTDLSMITYGNTTHFCLNVAERLAQEGWSVEVIDLRSLIPLDKETIYASVKKTSKALVVHEDKVFSGFGAEIAAGIGTELFRYLDAPVQRVGSVFTPVGFHPILEKAILPTEDKIYDAARTLLEY